MNIMQNDKLIIERRYYILLKVISPHCVGKCFGRKRVFGQVTRRPAVRNYDRSNRVAHPHRILIATPEPKRLATRLIDQDGLHSISFSEEQSRVELETQEPDRFYALLAELVLDDGATIHEISSPDDNLEAVFHYLVGK